MISSFLTVSSPDENGNLELSPDWLQGRGVYGGAVAGAMVRAMEAVAGDRRMRSFTAHFCAPAVPGQSRVSVEVLRPGGRVSSLRAEVRGQELYAFAVASFGAARPAGAGEVRFEDRRMPEVLARGVLPEVLLSRAGAPIFTQHFRYNPASTITFFSGAETARIALWVRPLVPIPLDMALVVGLLDAGPAGIIAKDRHVRPIASVDFRVQVPGALPEAPPDAWYLLDSYCEQAGEGYCSEQRHLWTEDGRLVAECRQLIAILG